MIAPQVGRMLIITRTLPSTSSERLALPSIKPPSVTHSLQFDSRKGATWHCVVGRNFGSFVTHGTTYILVSQDVANSV